MATVKFSVKTASDETRKVACKKCNRLTNHKVWTIVTCSWDVPGPDIQGTDHYEIISCLGCEEVSFRLSSTNSEDYYTDEEGDYHQIFTEEIFPNRLAGRSPLVDQYRLPHKVREIYRETHSALSTKLKILAGVGIGALIEAVCLEEKAKGRNLSKKIDDLAKKGVLTEKNAAILHKTRFLRNRSAHELEAASDAELSVAFDILENLLQTIYIIPQKAVGLAVKLKSTNRKHGTRS